MKNNIRKENNYWDNYMQGRIASWADMKTIKSYARGKILDIGCGDGSHIKQLKNQGELYGIDVTDSLLKEAKNKYPNINFVKSVGEKTPFDDNYFDLIFSIEVVEHIKEPEIMFKEVKRILKSGGYFIFQTPNYPIKRVYDLIYWLYRKGYKFRDDPTHVTKKNSRWWVNLTGKHFEIQIVTARNILLERIFHLGSKIKKSLFGLTFGQKIIVIAKK